MNMKEYLLNNAGPLLKDEKNVFILLWIEGKGIATALDISKATNISLSEVNTVLQKLFKNQLINLFEEGYTITQKGVEILDRLGCSNIQIQNILKRTEFKGVEFELYYNLFSVFRKSHLNLYLFLLYASDKENKKEYEFTISVRASKEWNLSKASFTYFIVSLVYEVGHIVYSSESSNLINCYRKLYEFSKKEYCYSSEKYHNEFNNTLDTSVRDRINKYYSEISQKMFLKYYLKKTGADIKELKLYLNNNLNEDLELSYEIISKNQNSLKFIFECSSLEEFAKEYGLSTSQANFVVKALQSKLKELMDVED